MIRRNDPRVETSFYLNKVVGGVPYLVRATNLSRSGLHIHKLLEPTLDSGTPTAVEFALPNSSQVVWADVDPVWEHGRHSMGLKFRNLTPRVQRLIDDYVQENVGSAQQ